MMQMNQTLIFAVSIIATLSFGCAGDSVSSNPTSAETTVDNEGESSPSEDVPNSSPDIVIPEFDFSGLEEAAEDWLADYAHLRGAGIIVVHRDYGVIYRQGFGEFKADRIYLVASVTKMVVSGILNSLHDQQILDLDGPIAEIVPWASDHPDITPAQLLSNSSGLPGLFDGQPDDYLCQYYHWDTLQNCAEVILTSKQDDDELIEPDTEFRYGGAQWQIAGAVAEVASGMSWEELFRRTYIEPCELENTGFANHIYQLFELVHGYPDGFNGDPTTLVSTDNPFMEGGLYSTLDDIAKLLLMHIQGGVCGTNQVHPTAAIQRMHVDRIAEVYNGSTNFPLGAVNLQGYGMGWWIDRENSGLTYDPGAYGAFPYVDHARGYAAFSVIEGDSIPGSILHTAIRPHIEQAIDEETESIR